MTTDDKLRTQLGAWLRGGYGLQVMKVCRIASGTATDNFRVDHDGGTVMVKMYRPGAGLEHERRVLAVTDDAAQAALPVPHLYRSTTGALLHEADGLAASVWQWCDSDSPPGPLTVDVAYETGSVLARLHTYLRQHDDGSWPVAQPHYRRHTLNHIRQRFTMLARHIETLPQPTSLDTLNLKRLRQRLTELRHVPGLLESATPPAYALVHGDFVRPNLLVHNRRLRAVIDMRLKHDEPVRELGRLAFDVETIAAGGDWLEVAEAALTGYLAEGGIVPTTAFYGCARLALLHSLCSTYPVEDLYFDAPPAHLRADFWAYWANRVTAVGQMLEHLDKVDTVVARLARLPRLPQPQSVAAPTDPRLLLPVAATARGHLRELITSNAQAAGAKALLLWGSEAAEAADPLSDLDLIAVVDDSTESLPPEVLVARLFEPTPLLFSRTVTRNGPGGGFYRGVCAQVAGLPIWADIYVWPACAAVIAADTTVVFDHLGLPRASETFWDLLNAQRAHADGNPHDEAGSDLLLGQLIAAKCLARHTSATQSAQPQARANGDGTETGGTDKGETVAVHSIEALDQWVSWCRALAETDWNSRESPIRIVRRTTKSTTAHVRSDGGKVVVKVLTGADPYQAGLFATETNVYRTLAAHPAQVPVPRILLSADRYLVTSEAEGAVLHPDRYPHDPLSADRVLTVLHALAQFATWAPDTIPRDTAVADLLHAQAAGMLTTCEADTYQTLRSQCRQWCLAHGDAIPANLLIGPRGACTLVDFENTGWHVPGYDYAVLRTVLTMQPDTITALIDQFATTHAGNAAYTINLITAAAREVRLHTFFAPDPTGRRQHLVGQAWAHARQRLRHHPDVTATVSGASR